MNLKEILKEALCRIAPELDFEALDPSKPIREQVELDSMDYLNFLIRVQKESGIALPARDSGEFATLNGLLAYLHRNTVTKEDLIDSSESGMI
jgi:acyl carrier protein